MNQLNYLQELSYIYENENVGGVAKAKAVFCINNIINAIIQNDEQSESDSVVENTSDLELGKYINDIAISTLENYSTVFLDKRADSEILKGGLAEFNEIYKKTQEELKNKELYNKLLSESHTEKEYNQKITYSTASYPGGDCCNQSGLLSCDEPLVVNVKHSGDVFVLNSPQQSSGVFVPNLTIDVVKGVETQFVVNTVINGTGHPFAITGFPIGGITGPIDSGILSMTIPIDYSGYNIISYICTSGIESEPGHSLSEGGYINILDPFRATMVSVRPEFVLQAGTHDYIDDKYWKSDEDIPCKYGGVNEIKAFFNNDASCVDLSNFIYHATGLHGYQQYFPASVDVEDKFQFRDLYLKNPFGDYIANTETCTLEAIDQKRYRVLIGRREDSMKVYNSPGDIDYGINSTKWPAERVNIYVSGRYTNLPGIHDCGDVKDVHILNKYNYKLCESSGISYRNISLVDIRSNFYAVGTAFKSEYGALQMEYSKTLVSAFADGVTGATRMFLDENLDPIFITASPNWEEGDNVNTVGYRARNGLTTYDGYITSLIVENREWDHNAGHAYLKTNINATQQGQGLFKVIDIDEIGRNDPEFGAIDWFMGSAVIIPGKITALAGMSFRGSPTFRCPGYSWSDGGTPPEAFTSCVGQLEDLYGNQGCSAGDVTFSLDSSHLTFLPNSFAGGASISDIEPLMRIQGPYMPGGAIVESVHDSGGDGCGPYIKMNIHMVDNLLMYPESAIFNDRKYFNYKFFNANISNGSNSVDIKYPLRSNKAVLYAYGINTPQGVITIFVAFEYYESWIALGGNRVIYPRYKIETLWPSQTYGNTGWTSSSWNPLYRPVSLSAVEAKRSQTCHEVTLNVHGDIPYSVSDRDCQGLYPYYDFNTITCPGLPCASFTFHDPCGACQSVAYNTSTGRPGMGVGPCLAEDILDYEGNSFYNGFTLVDSQHPFGNLYSLGDRKRFLEPTDSVEGINNFGHEANYPSGNADDPHIRGGSAGGVFITSTDDQGNPVQTFQTRSRPGPDGDKGQLAPLGYVGPISPVSDLIQKTQMTRMPKTVGGYDEDFSDFSSPHPDAQSQNAPTSNDPFYVYTSDGYVNFIITLAGEVGVVEHEYLHPPVNALRPYGDNCNVSIPFGLDEDWTEEVFVQQLYFGDIGPGSELWSYEYRPFTAEEAEAAKVCFAEVVPLSLGHVTATTTLNNLHINVGMDHTPLTSSETTEDSNTNSFPDLWTPKYIRGVVDYMGTAGNLQPANVDAEGTTIVNKLALQHQASTKDYDTVSDLQLIGAVSNVFDDNDLEAYVLKERKIYHVNHNIGAYVDGGPFSDCGVGSNWYCYPAPEKVLNDGACVSSFPGPRSFDRYLLNDPYEDYQNIWASRRCCHQNPGCSCSDGSFDSFGFNKSWHGINSGGSSSSIYGHILDGNAISIAKKFGHEVQADFGFRLRINYAAFDPRVNDCCTNTITATTSYEICGGADYSQYEYPAPNNNPPGPGSKLGPRDPGTLIAANDGYGPDWGRRPYFAQGVKNGGAWALDNEQEINGVNLETIDCCYLPADLKCPVFYFGFNTEIFGEFDTGSMAGAFGNYKSAEGKQRYISKISVNGTVYEVDPVTTAGVGWNEGGFTGEIQFYVSKKDDGNHSVFVRSYVEAAAIIGHEYQEGDVICHLVPTFPEGSTDTQPSVDAGQPCYTVQKSDIPRPATAEYPGSNPGVYRSAGCDKGNPYVLFSQSNTVELHIPTGFVNIAEWSDWNEVPCDDQSNSVDLTFSSNGFTGYLYLKGDCKLSFLIEGETATNCPAVNTNCIMGPKRIFP